MNEEELKDIVNLYIKDLCLNDWQEQVVHMLAKNIEREVCYKIVCMTDELRANIVNRILLK